MIDDWSFDLGELSQEVANLPDLAGYDVALDDGFSFDIGNLASEIENLGGLDLSGVGVADDLFGVNPDVYLPTGTDLWEEELGSFDRGLMDRYASDIQDLGTTMSPTVEREGTEYLNLSGYDEGRLPSQWQTVAGTDLKVMIQDDPRGGGSTAIGFNPETGTTFSLEPSQVQALIQQGKLNSFGSGYNTATGGNRVAPGGGTRMPDGSIKKPDGTIIKPDGTVKLPNGQVVPPGKGPTAGPGAAGSQSDLLKLLLPILLMMAMRDKGGASNAVIPALQATQKQTPYSQQRPAGYRPGQGGITYFEPTQYTPRMAGGGIIDLARALAAKRREQRQGLLKGRGDGVSDSIPAMIGRDQPARLARGEYVVDARTVAELGNGSTDAGAERLDEMRQRVHSKRKKAKVGQDSKAYKALPA